MLDVNKFVSVAKSIGYGGAIFCFGVSAGMKVQMMKDNAQQINGRKAIENTSPKGIKALDYEHQNLRP